jgi:hypothetical protein
MRGSTEDEALDNAAQCPRSCAKRHDFKSWFSKKRRRYNFVRPTLRESYITQRLIVME